MAERRLHEQQHIVGEMHYRLAVNAQVPPKFADRVPRTFPFADEDLIAGTKTACQVLAFYRQIYTPAADSPLLDAGDPQEGAGNDIGAVGAGTANELDKFGRMCDPADTGNPVMPANAYDCPPVPLEVTVVDPNTPVNLPRGWSCVC